LIGASSVTFSLPKRSDLGVDFVHLSDDQPSSVTGILVAQDLFLGRQLLAKSAPAFDQDEEGIVHGGCSRVLLAVMSIPSKRMAAKKPSLAAFSSTHAGLIFATPYWFSMIAPSFAMDARAAAIRSMHSDALVKISTEAGLSIS
jgi:hypothetical protein